MLALCFLTSAATLAALGIAVRACLTTRSERFLVASLSIWALIATPVLVLGYTNALTRLNLGAASMGLSGAVLALTSRGRGGVLAHFRECLTAGLDLARLPLDGLREAWRERSPTLLIVAYSGGLFLLSTVVVVLTPRSTWDGFFYHEPIVGYAIQNHGFRVVDLPRNFNVQAVNGYPRLCEAVSLWPVIFSDKTLIELPNTLATAPLAVAMFTLARRFTDRLTSMGWAGVLFLVPQIWSQSCSTYIDNQVGFFLVAGMAFASRPGMRVRDGVLATLAMVLVVGSKGSWPILIPAIAVVAYGRLAVAHGRARTAATIATIAGGGAVIAGVAAVTLVRNLLAFRNPFWPFTIEWPAAHFGWTGLTTLAYIHNPPFSELAHTYYFEPPQGGWDDLHRRGAGLAVAWVVLPVAALGFAAAIPAALNELRLRGARPQTRAVELWLATIPGLVALRWTPSLEEVRYNEHLVAALCLGCAWALRGPSWRAFRQAVLGAAIILSLLQFGWIRDPVLASDEEILADLTHPFGPSRAHPLHPTFDLLARERDDELHPGDVVAYTDDLAFVGAAWNFQMSNRVEYVPYKSAAQFDARIAALHAKWAIVGAGSDARKQLEATGRWEVVGTLTAAFDAVAMRRRGSS